MTEFGPLANTVSDAALMLDVLAGSSACRHVEQPERGLRIAVSTKSPTVGARVTSEVKAAVEETAALLREAGHQVQHDDPPYSISLA